MVPMGGNKVSPNPGLVDTYPDVYLSTGLVAENHARLSGISRDEQDAFALRSHQRAVAAIEAGRFKDEIVPLTVTVVDRTATANGGKPTIPTREITFDIDEGPRRDTSPEALAKLRPAFHARHGHRRQFVADERRRGGRRLITSADYAKAHGLKPLARFVAYATAGVAPELFGIGPVPAIKKVLKLAGLTLDQIDLDRAQRGVRRAGARLPEGAADRSRAAERQRRRDRARPSAGLHRREADGDARARDAAARQPLRHGDDVRRRRHGRSGNLRTNLTNDDDRKRTTTRLRHGTFEL